MKKRLFILFILTLTSVLLLAGCSCQKLHAYIDIEFDYDYEYDESHTDEEIRSHMHVYFYDTDGSMVEVSDYTITRITQNGGVAIKVTYQEYEDTFRLVGENKYTSIVARRANNNVLFYDLTEDDIKNSYDVFGITADGQEEEIYSSNYTVVIDKEFYTGGKHTLTIIYKNLSCEIEISVYEQECYVSFNTQSDIKLEPIILGIGAPVPELPTPTRVGYIFRGWKLDGEYFTEGTLLTKSITLIADWEAIVGHIYFMIDGAVVHEQDYICEKTEILVPELPEITGYDAEWEKYTLDGSIIYVSPVYTPKVYTLTFDYKGATSGDDVKQISVTYGKEIGHLPEPEKEGYSLTGWRISTYSSNQTITPETVWTWTEDKGAYAFWIVDRDYIFRAPDLTYELNDDGLGYTVTGYGEETAAMTRFRVPAEYNSLPVTTVGDRAFKNHPNAFYIVVDEGIKHIDRSAFYGISALRGIKLPETLESIGDYAFQYTVLQELDLPSSLRSIGDYTFRGLTTLNTVTASSSSALEEIGLGAFSQCSSLKNVTIPKNVTAIGKEAFGGCTSLTNIYIYDLSAWCEIDFESESSNPAYYGDLYYCNELITELVIPSDVTRIAPYAFYSCKNITSVTFEAESLAEVIGKYSFFNCDALKEVSFDGDASLLKIETMAFHNVKLTSLEVPSSLAMIEKGALNSNPKKIIINDLAAWCQISFGTSLIGESTTLSISDCSSVDIVIPKSVTRISPYAFYNYSYIKTLSFEDDSELVEICGYAFDHSKVVSVSLPATLEHIGTYAFAHCSYLESIDLTHTAVTAIDDYAFFYSYLGEFTLPASITSLGEHVFSNCENLTSFYFENEISITNIPSGTFSGCSALRNITLPNSVTSLGSLAFFNCSNLESINLDFIDYIDDSFRGCEKLCTLENHVYYIGTWAVAYDAENCVDVVIKDGTLRVASMFAYNDNLKSVVLPASITKLYPNMFGGCSSLINLTLPFIGETMPNADSEEFIPFGALFGSNWYGGVSCTQKYYDKASGEIKEMTYNIPENLSWVRVLTGVIPYNAFSNVSFLKNITMGYEVTGICDYAFYGCTSLTGQPFEASEDGNTSISFIGDYAFAKCQGLSGDLYIPENVTRIGDYAFNECTNINTVTCYEDVQTIGIAAFGNCSKLRSFTITSDTNCQYIGDAAFAFCYALESFRIPINATLGERMFMYCYSLKEFTALTDGNDFRIRDGVVYDGEGKVLRYYPGGSARTSFAIPEGVVKVEPYAFHGTANLTSVTIPSTLEEIGEYSFIFCTSLTSISFSGTPQLKKIGGNAFWNSKLSKIKIPDSVEFIGAYAFELSTYVSFENNDAHWIAWEDDRDDYVDLKGKFLEYYYDTYYNYNWEKI